MSSVTSLSGSTTTNTNSSSLASASSSGSQLSQTDFMKLLVAQLNNQDPTQPVDSSTFVNQLAQMSLVEQAVTQSSQLSTIQTQLQSLANSGNTGLIGKQVTVNESNLTFDGTFAATTNVVLQGAASTVTAQILDSNGNVVRSLNLGANPAGNLAINWDGKNTAGTTQPAGNYQVQVAATSASGASVNVSTTATDIVTQISYANGGAQVGLQSGATASLGNITSVAAAPVTTTTTSK